MQFILISHFKNAVWNVEAHDGVSVKALISKTIQQVLLSKQTALLTCEIKNIEYCCKTAKMNAASHQRVLSGKIVLIRQ